MSVHLWFPCAERNSWVSQSLGCTVRSWESFRGRGGWWYSWSSASSHGISELVFTLSCVWFVLDYIIYSLYMLNIYWRVVRVKTTSFCFKSFLFSGQSWLWCISLSLSFQYFFFLQDYFSTDLIASIQTSSVHGCVDVSPGKHSTHQGIIVTFKVPFLKEMTISIQNEQTFK